MYSAKRAIGMVSGVKQSILKRNSLVSLGITHLLIKIPNEAPRRHFMLPFLSCQVTWVFPNLFTKVSQSY